jgi:hypothetical protein
MRKEYGYAVVVSTRSGKEIADSKKRGFGFIDSQVSKARAGASGFLGRPVPSAYDTIHLMLQPTHALFNL